MVVPFVDDIITCLVIADIVRRLATIVFVAFHDGRRYLML